jgi:quercetin dioxygenase-like cupin family protein
MMSAEPAEVRSLAAIVPYKKDTVVRHDVLTRRSGRITLFAIDGGQEWRGEALAAESMLAGLEGEAAVVLTGSPHALRAGDMLTVPPGIAPTVHAAAPFKMMLVAMEDPVGESDGSGPDTDGPEAE